MGGFGDENPHDVWGAMRGTFATAGSTIQTARGVAKTTAATLASFRLCGSRLDFAQAFLVTFPAFSLFFGLTNAIQPIYDEWDHRRIY